MEKCGFLLWMKNKNPRFSFFWNDLAISNVGENACPTLGGRSFLLEKQMPVKAESVTRELLLQHDFQYGAIGFDHSLGAQGAEILHGLLG